MGKKSEYLNDAFNAGVSIGSNEDLSVSEAFGEYKGLVKNEFAKTKDLAQARQERKDAVAKRLNALREISGEKQRDVANAIGVNVITLSGYEVGRSEPNLEVLVRLADFYKVSLDYVLCRTDTRIEFDKEEYSARDAERTEMNAKIKQLESQISEIKDAIK